MDARKRQIFDLVCSKGFAAPEELARLCRVSAITARRDLIWLEKAGMLERVHGGAVPAVPPSGIAHIHARIRIAVKEKRLIAKHAAAMAAAGSRIFLDAGSTCSFLAEELAEDLDLTVITYSLDNIRVLAGKRGIRLIAPGGEFDQRINAFVGPITEATLSSFHFDIAFLAATGVDLDKGLTDNGVHEGGVKRIAAANSDRRVVLADGSKLGKVAFKTFLRLDEFPLTIVTDTAASKEFCASLQKCGIDVQKPHGK